MFRPRATRWFEILTARDDATLVLEALARTGAVELEARPDLQAPESWAELEPLLARYRALRARFGAYWPAASECRPSAFPEPPLVLLERSLATLQAWAQQAEQPIGALQDAQARRDELLLWQPALRALQDRPLDAAAVAAAGPWLQTRLFVLPEGADLAPLLEAGTASLATPLATGQGTGWLVTAPPATLAEMSRAVTSLKGSGHALPPGLPCATADDLQAVKHRVADLEREVNLQQATLGELGERLGLRMALGDALRADWVLQHVHTLEASEWLCWITGWSGDAGGEQLANALQACPARALWRVAPPPSGLLPPLLLDNPPWARPFEIFSRALGMPGATEADPSPLLALVVPLMFGYMFGDVGQGLVILAVGIWGRRRWAVAPLLVAGGLSAVLFGCVFGAVFGLHGWLPALWLHPLDAPLMVLAAPLAGGALLMTLGLGLDALAAAWSGQARHWWRTDAALPVIYLGLLAGFFSVAGLWCALGGVLWFCAGHGWEARRPAAVFSALGQTLEKTLQILINTLSFARVGAFALAHAGLSTAIGALVAAADGLLAKALVLVLGNALVILLEAMVVSIQTTRLVLFEFFTRFMHGQGRAFKPLPAPPFTLQET